MDFSPDLFDKWAAGYDQEVAREEGFPFSGYQKLFDRFIEECDPHPGQRVLDLGCGTGNLAARFHACGCEVWGIDFSPAMIYLASSKYPSVQFAIQDIRSPLPAKFPERYDFIVSAYAFHHFPIQEKIRIIQTLHHNHLTPDGRLLIGDLVFSDRLELIETGKLYPEQWDEEPYWVLAEDIVPILKSKLFFSVERISFCASMMEFGLAE